MVDLSEEVGCPWSFVGTVTVDLVPEESLICRSATTGCQREGVQPMSFMGSPLGALWGRLVIVSALLFAFAYN